MVTQPQGKGPTEIPVISRDRPATKARFWQANITPVPAKIVTYNPARMVLTVLNTGAAMLFLDAKRPNPVRSFPLPGGAAISLNNYIGELWISSTAPVIVGFIEMEL